MSAIVRSAKSIREIGRTAWDALAGEELFSSYGWLRTLETAQARPRPPFYWWVEDQEGIVAAVAARLRGNEPPSWNIDLKRYGRLAYLIRPLRSVLQRQPTLVCGGQMGPAAPILARRDLSPDDYQTAARALLEAVEQHCREQRWRLVFRGVVEPGGRLRRAFSGRPYIVGRESPGTVIDIHWSSWQDYLKELKQAHPATQKMTRQQLNRGRRGGVVIEEVTDPEMIEPQLYRLLADHHYRKNRDSFYMGPHFPTLLKKHLGERAVILVARRDGRIVGVTIHLRNRTAMQLKFVGIAEEVLRGREAVYFNLTYSRLIERACTLGCRQLYFGILTYEPKYRRGARLVPTESWLWEPGRVRRWSLQQLLSYQARRQERLLKRFADQSLGQGHERRPCYQWPEEQLGPDADRLALSR